MKKFALLALLLSLGVFTIGCETKKKEAPKAPEGGAEAAPAADAAPAGEEKK